MLCRCAPGTAGRREKAGRQRTGGADAKEGKDPLYAARPSVQRRAANVHWRRGAESCRTERGG